MVILSTTLCLLFIHSVLHDALSQPVSLLHDCAIHPVVRDMLQQEPEREAEDKVAELMLQQNLSLTTSSRFPASFCMHQGKGSSCLIDERMQLPLLLLILFQGYFARCTDCACSVGRICLTVYCFPLLVMLSVTVRYHEYTFGC